MVKLDTTKLRLNELETSNYLKKFDLVILADQSFDTVKKVDGICRQQKIRFIAGGVYGWTGYAFFDFDGFEFLMWVFHIFQLLLSWLIKSIFSPAPKEHTLIDEKKEDDKQADLSSPTKKLKLDSETEKVIETVTLEEDNAKIKKSISFPSFVDSLKFDPEKLTKGLIRRLKPANFIIVNGLYLH